MMENACTFRHILHSVEVNTNTYICADIQLFQTIFHHLLSSQDNSCR